jgi:hypothetical protein
MPNTKSTQDKTKAADKDAVLPATADRQTDTRTAPMTLAGPEAGDMNTDQRNGQPTGDGVRDADIWDNEAVLAAHALAAYLDESEPFDGDAEADPLSMPGYDDPASLDPQVSVESWKIEAVGRRPEDFLVRDCLFASLFRDKRATWFHRSVKKPQDWMTALVAHLPESDQAQALQYVVLHYLHKCHLARRYPAVYSGVLAGEEERELRSLKRLWHCWPTGVLLSEPEDDGDRVYRACDLAWLCPWCHARKVLDLHRRLTLAEPHAGCQHLIVARAGFVEPVGGLDGTARDSDLREFVKYLTSFASSPEEAEHVGWSAGGYLGREPARIAETRTQVLATLLGQVRGFGLDRGGVWTSQLSPWQNRAGRRTFRHDAALLTAVDEPTYQQLPPRLLAQMRSSGAFRTPLGIHDLFIEWSSASAAHPQALRLLLAGSAHNYYSSGLGLPDQAYRFRNGRSEGVAGILGWQPTFLLDAGLWPAYAEVTRGWRLYQSFGTWRQALRETGSTAKTGKKAPAQRQGSGKATSRQGQAARWRKKEGLRRGNAGRKQQAADRRHALLEVARGVVGQGSVPGRVHLGELLIASGVSPSELSQRVLRWLARELKPGTAQAA